MPFQLVSIFLHTTHGWYGQGTWGKKWISMCGGAQKYAAYQALGLIY